MKMKITQSALVYELQMDIEQATWVHKQLNNCLYADDAYNTLSVIDAYLGTKNGFFGVEVVVDPRDHR